MKYEVLRVDGGKQIPVDEPCFVIRAKDVLAPSMLKLYLANCQGLNLPVEFQWEVEDHLEKVLLYQSEHRDLVKLPD